MLTSDEITEISCITDDFCKEYSKQTTKKQILPSNDKKHRNRSCKMYLLVKL